MAPAFLHTALMKVMAQLDVTPSPLTDSAVLLGAIGALFGYLMFEMRDRRARAEKQTDKLLDDVPKILTAQESTNTILSEMKAAINAFAHRDPPRGG